MDDVDEPTGKWTLYFRDPCPCMECLTCDGSDDADDQYFYVEALYLRDWAFFLHEEIGGFDETHEDYLAAMEDLHPVNSLSRLARHCGMSMSKEADRWWWAKFIYELTPQDMYNEDDLGPPSMGHLCDREDQFINYKRDCHKGAELPL